MTSEYEKIMDALNRIDEFANETVRDNDNGEAEQLARDYNEVSNFISKYAKK